MPHNQALSRYINNIMAFYKMFPCINNSEKTQNVRFLFTKSASYRKFPHISLKELLIISAKS